MTSLFSESLERAILHDKTLSRKERISVRDFFSNLAARKSGQDNVTLENRTGVIAFFKDLASRRSDQFVEQVQEQDSPRIRTIEDVAHEDGIEISSIRSDGTREDFLENYRRSAADGAGVE